MICDRCGKSHVVKQGKNLSGHQRYKCIDCKRIFTGQEKFKHLTKEQIDLIPVLVAEGNSIRAISRILRNGDPDAHVELANYHIKKKAKCI